MAAFRVYFEMAKIRGDSKSPSPQNLHLFLKWSQLR